jgi:hypothetical protein
MLRNHLGKAPVYVVSPIDVIAIGRVPHPWIKRELEMIVCIYESREEQEPVQVYIGGLMGRFAQSRWGVEDTRYAIACDLNRRMRRDPRAHGAPGSANYELTFRDQRIFLNCHGASLSS